MMAYTYKMVNGVKIALNSGDQTKLAAKDAANWTSGPVPTPPALTATAKLARLAAAFKLTVAELKAEIFRP